VGVGQGVGRLRPEPGDGRPVVPPAVREAPGDGQGRPQRSRRVGGEVGRRVAGERRGRGGFVRAREGAGRGEPAARHGHGEPVGRGRPRCPSLQPAEFVDHRVDPLAADELHGVEVPAARLAGAEHRGDVGVVQPGGGLRLPPKPLQPPGVGQRLGRQHLEGDVPPQALLDRLVHHPHAAPADLAEDAELAQPGRRRQARRGRDERPGPVARPGLELLHLEQRGEQFADLVGEVGAAVGVLREGRSLAGPDPGDKLLGQHVERVTVGGRVGHGGPSWGAGARLRVYLRGGGRRPPVGPCTTHRQARGRSAAAGGSPSA
jgi:hypothetical protein